VKTPQTRKLTVDGLTKAYPVYKVRLDWLFYNDQNDRIATWISQYKAQHNGQAPSSTDREAYNAIIEQFIVESNPDALRKTQNNIEMVDQREAGVVLADGRIIDGNRRFTCLRRLAAKNSRFGYFETVILDRDIENSAKQIKTARMVAAVSDFDYFLCRTEIEALALENTLIKQHTPKYNIRLKDAKSYPYIKLTAEPYPRLVFTRARAADKGRYFGPYSGASVAGGALRTLQKILCLPTCRRRFPADT
jgi:hypothetical protein